MFLINNYMAFMTIKHYKVLRYKNSTIIASIALSFALFFTFANLNLALGQNASSSGETGGNSTSTLNQTSTSLNQTQSGIGASNQGPLTSQIEKQIQINQANQTGRSEYY